jgi:hypothetical protein
MIRLDLLDRAPIKHYTRYCRLCSPLKQDGMRGTSVHAFPITPDSLYLSVDHTI